MYENIKVQLSDALLSQLGQSNMTTMSALAELIDNAIGSMVGNEVYVKVQFIGDNDDVSKIRIIDNAAGIKLSELPKILGPGTLAGTRKNSLHEHGMGLKNAIATLSGKIDNGGYIGFKIISKSKEEKSIFSIDRISLVNDIPVTKVNEDPFDTESGTIIELNMLKAPAYTRKQDYKKLESFIGAKYQQYIHGTINDKRLKIEFEYLYANKKGKMQTETKTIDAVKAYWRNNMPEVDRELGGKSKGWTATLKFGFCPTESEYRTHDMNIPQRMHPYYNKNNKCDLFHNDRMLGQFDYEYIINIEKDDALIRYFRGGHDLRMQVYLREGFNTSATKDGVLKNKNWDSLKEKISTIIKDEIAKPKYGSKKFISADDDETDIKNKMEERFKKLGTVYTRESVLEFSDLRADFITDGVICEVKRGAAGSDAVSQLFGYIKLSESTDVNKKLGKLYAETFSSGAKNAVKRIHDNHGINISLVCLDDFFGVVKESAA